MRFFEINFLIHKLLRTSSTNTTDKMTKMKVYIGVCPITTATEISHFIAK